MALGNDETVALQRIKALTASMALGYDEATVLTLIRTITASMALGYSEAVAITHNTTGINLSSTATGGSTGASTTVTLSTAANDIVLIYATVESSTSSTPSVGTVTSANLTFSRIARDQDTTSASRTSVELWAALSPGAHASEVITVTNSGSIGEAIGVIGQNWSGVHTSLPFEVSPTFDHNFTATGTQVTAPAVTTTDANTVVIGFAGNINAPVTVGTGYTAAGSKQQNGASNAASIFAEYKAQAAAAGSISVPFVGSVGHWSGGSFALRPSTATFGTVEQVITQRTWAEKLVAAVSSTTISAEVGAGEVVILVVANENAAAGNATVSSISSANGVTYTLLGHDANTGNPSVDQGVYYGVYDAAHAGNDTLTITWSASVDVGMIYMSLYYGVDHASPTAGVYASLKTTTASTTPQMTANFDTGVNNAKVFAALMGTNAGQTAAGGGWNDLQRTSKVGAARTGFEAIADKTIAVRDTASTVGPWGTATAQWVMSAIALRPAQGPPVVAHQASLANSANTQSTRSLTFTSAVIGDVLIIGVATTFTGGPNRTVSTLTSPSVLGGFTKAAQTFDNTGGNGAYPNMEVWYGVVTSAGSAVATVTLSGTADALILLGSRYSNVDPTTPLSGVTPVVSGARWSSSTAIPSISITPVDPNSMTIGFNASTVSTTASAAPNTSAIDDGISGLSGSMEYRVAGSTVARNVAFGTAASNGIIALALRPKGGL
jgi:hypothetical protein